MTESSPADMHPDFARWYSTVSLGNDDTRRSARWAGVVNATAGLSSSYIEALVRLAFKSRQRPDAAAVVKIRKAFHDADETFDMQGNDRELQVLTAIALVVLMQDKGAGAAEAAMAITTAALAGARQYELPMDLPGIADSAIDVIADARRQRPTLKTLSQIGRFDFEEAVTKVNENQTFDGVMQAIKTMAVTTKATLDALVKRQSSLSESAAQFFAVQDEELQMLWWLIGGRCVSFDCTIESLSPELRPLAVANDLAQETEFTPGPVSLKSLLIRAGLSLQSELEIPQAISACSAGWLEELVGELEPSPVTKPIHFGMKRQLEVGEGDSWVANWKAALEIQEVPKLSPLELATLFYRERLLIQFEGK